MKIRTRNKDKMRYAPKWRHGAPYRKDAVYYEDSCCKGCYWDWGHSFTQRHRYKHGCIYSNYMGLLKKYWVSSIVDYDYGEDEEYEESAVCPCGADGGTSCGVPNCYLVKGYI